MQLRLLAGTTELLTDRVGENMGQKSCNRCSGDHEESGPIQNACRVTPRNGGEDKNVAVDVSGCAAPGTVKGHVRADMASDSVTDAIASGLKRGRHGPSVATDTAERRIERIETNFHHPCVPVEVGDRARPAELADRVGTMIRDSWNRLLAWLVDWFCILVWVAVIAAIGVPIYRAGITGGLTLVAQNVIASLVLVVPVTLMLARLESSPREASIGKQLRHLLVVNSRTGQRVSFLRALARNTMKIAIPWAIGHAAVYGIVASSAAGSIPPAIWVATAIAYVLPLTCVASLFVASGRTPYDRISGTMVTPAARKPFGLRGGRL